MSLLSNLKPEKQQYYRFLATRCFSEFSKAEDFFNVYNYPAAEASLFSSSEFFWKALTILSGKDFEERHEAYREDVKRISNHVLRGQERLHVIDILTHFPSLRRGLAFYGHYEKGGMSKEPSSIFRGSIVKKDIRRVRILVKLLRRIHYSETFLPPIKIGVLSGFVEGSKNETPCNEYEKSIFFTADAWVEKLNQLKVGTTRLFDASLITVRDLGRNLYPIAVNPFGEVYPEKGKGEGPGFSTISYFMRNGGILVNTAGIPFLYGWDVKATSSNRQLLATSVPTIAGIKIEQREGKNVLIGIGTHVIAQESMILTRRFGVDAFWDVPDKIVGPQDLQLDYVGFGNKLPMRLRPSKAKVFRPLNPNNSIIPFNQVTTEYWKKAYPTALVPHGLGHLVYNGMSLETESEALLLLHIIELIVKNPLKIIEKRRAR